MGAIGFYQGVCSNSLGFLGIQEDTDLIKLIGQAKSPRSPLSVVQKRVRVNIVSN